jgi:peptidoglycan DL-endopeptidase CwlO
VALSLAGLEQPMIEARDKLNVDTGTASQLQDDLNSASTTLDDYCAQHKADAGALTATWSGDRADTFAGAAPQVSANLTTASGQASTAANAVGAAMGIVQGAEKQVQSLIDEFAAKAGPLIAAANAVTRGGDNGAALAAQSQAMSLAAQYAAKAAQVVDGAKSQLTQTLAGLNAPTQTQTSAAPSLGTRDAPTGGGGGGGGGSSHHSGGGGGGGGVGPSGGKAIVTPPSSQFGSGTQINLPGGMGVVNAPNERAAIAVRAALTQLGVPYQWGGNTPGKGLDCSGLTHWAYGQAGIGLPRLAQEQTIGMKISESDLQPGDLVVWDGHVAMYIGDGKMIEEPHTGEVCHIVPLRTSNAGDAFEGFYRPSA